MTRNVIFSDLDGTLLDPDTYAFNAALPALRLIASQDIPLVICSSKTRPEIESIRSALGNRDPFVSENGGAAFIPEGMFDDVPGGKRIAGYAAVEWGRPYAVLREALAAARARTGAVLSGYGDKTVEEIMRETGLDRESARSSKQREYDEPFTSSSGEACIPDVVSAVKEFGLRVVCGGRYFHLMGENDKGRAVRYLADLYRRKTGPIRTIGLGDSDNDVSLLQSVDVPILVRRHDGTFAKTPPLPGLIRTRSIGPLGWNEAVLGIIGTGRSSTTNA